MSEEFAIGLITDRLRRIKDGESINDVYNDLGAYDDLKDPCVEMLRQLERDRESLADAYLAEHAASPPKHACDHCGAFFRVEVVGIHHPKRGVVMCPFCGNEPKKMETP